MTVEAVSLTKRYGSTLAVDDLSFTVQPGLVTGFLGPNGSGKSTTMRLMLELDHGQGQTLWNGRRLTEVPSASRTVGAHLDAKFFHPNRTARNHLWMLAAEADVPKARVDEVIELVGLGSVADDRPKGFSLGMGQRLGLAGAILAEPEVLLLDEPANGLDPQSIQWLRDFLKAYAASGRAVFVSSHLLSEMQLMADTLVVIAKGRLIAEESKADFVARSTRNDVFARTPEPQLLVDALAAAGVTATIEGLDGVAITGAQTDLVGDVAFRHQVPLRELTPRVASLEEAFLELTSDSQDYATGGTGSITQTQSSGTAPTGTGGPA